MTYCERIDNPQYRIKLAELTKILGDSNAAIAALELNINRNKLISEQSFDSNIYLFKIYLQFEKEFNNPKSFIDLSYKKQLILSIVTFAEENNFFIQDVESSLLDSNEYSFLAVGSESKVYKSNDETHVIKLTALDQYNYSIIEALDQILAFNHIFKDSSITLHGIGYDTDGKIVLITSLNYFAGNEPNELELLQYCNDLGLIKDNGVYTKDGIICKDIATYNAIKTIDGIRIVDSSAEFETLSPLLILNFKPKKIQNSDQDAEDILSLIKYQYQIQYENPVEFQVNFEKVINGYLSGESWAIDKVRSLVDKVQIRQALLHTLGYDYNEELYDENGVFNWNLYLGGIDLRNEIENLSEEEKVNFTPIDNYQVDPAEVIMPKLYKTLFHLGNRSINEIDKDFFKKINSFYYSDLKHISKNRVIDSEPKLDFLVRCHNYKFNIIVSDYLSAPPTEKLKPIEVEVVDGYRIKNGERMYTLPERSQYQIYKDSKGNETIVFKNSEFVESSIKNLINSLDKKDLVSVLAFFENLEPTKEWLRYVMNINHIKVGNSSLKKLINQDLTSDLIRKELLQIYYENSDVYKDEQGRYPNKYKEELAETLYNSFLRTLEVISVRIPTQAFLSIMAARVVGLTNDESNNVFVNRWLFWLQGSDLDIKNY